MLTRQLVTRPLPTCQFCPYHPPVPAIAATQVAAHANAMVLLAHRADLYAHHTGDTGSLHIGPASPEGTDEAIALLAAAYSDDEAPAILLAGANDSTASATHHALTRAGITAILYLLAAIPADAGTSTATADIAGWTVAAWGARLPRHIQDVGIAPPPARRVAGRTGGSFWQLYQLTAPRSRCATLPSSSTTAAPAMRHRS